MAQVIRGVRWDDSIRRMMADGFDTFYEIGPGSGPDRPPQADRPQDPMHERPGPLNRAGSRHLSAKKLAHFRTDN